MTTNRREKRKMLARGLLPTPASGALSGWKGDGQDERWLVEYKATSKLQFILKKEIWQKVEKEAIKAHKLPRLEIDFGDLYLVVVSKDDFDEEIWRRNDD